MKRKRKTDRRRGAAVAELAVCLPAIVLLTMGALECCTMIYLRQTLHVAAYEGIRVAIREDMPTATALSRAQRVIDDRRVEGATISFTPADTVFLARGTPITIQVDAPCEGNNALPLRFFSGDLTAIAVMNKE